MAFFGGSTGAIYRQFSVTIASAMILSVLVAMTLTPALCASILKPIPSGGPVSAKGPMGRFFAAFNRRFEQATRRYHGGVEKVTRHRKLGVLAYAVILLAMGLLFWRLTTSFLPEEDQGMLMVQVKLPSGATQQQTLKTMNQVSAYLRAVSYTHLTLPTKA